MQNIINDIGQITAALSFILGTTTLALFLYFGENVIRLEYAFAFVIITVLINSIVFIILLGKALISSHYRQQRLITCACMLLNIPIALLYLYMVFTSPLLKTLPLK